MINMIYCHDSLGLAEVKAETFTHMGYNAEGIDTVRGMLDRIKRGVQNTDVVILHKDIGDYTDENIPNAVDKIVALLHEANETIRIGIVSGEYPNGEHHVLQLGADFYFETATDNKDPWLLEQINKGPVSPREISRRGKEVATPGPITNSGERNWG